MKKQYIPVIALFALTTATAAFAKPQTCYYTDHFHSDPQSLVLGAVTSDTNTQVTKTSDFSFDMHDLTCPPNAPNVAKAIYTGPNNGVCTLTVEDNELWEDPTILANCSGGLKYAGDSYDGFMSYAYTLHFQQA